MISRTCRTRVLEHRRRVRGVAARFGIASFATIPLLAGAPAKSVSTEPIQIAVFEFELEDFSAAAGVVGENAIIKEQLQSVTEAARAQLAQSGRYQIVDTRSSDAQAVKDHSLRHCDGCAAEIASKLGAEQSLVGLINKISMTEYTVTIQIRDAKTGHVVADAQTPLRMGASYSWSRGVDWLFKNKLMQPSAGAANPERRQ